ncbi:hypothetical protein FG062_14675 [Vibrio cholerae]|nr:hypothetical protein [Vibrio cholerae]EGR0600858.1 hypothetical protein [Vibrio cholerae]
MLGKPLNWTPPPCPSCGKDEMEHKCVSHVQGTAAFKKNGWYCQSCNAGPFQLGSVTEDECAAFANGLLNR